MGFKHKILPHVIPLLAGPCSLPPLYGTQLRQERLFMQKMHECQFPLCIGRLPSRACGLGIVRYIFILGAFPNHQLLEGED